MRRDRVRMLNANCIGAWWMYCPRFSNHSRLACAARWVETTTGRRSASYAASDSGTLSCSDRLAARASASSIASFVPEPIEKWAVWAASPNSTTFSWLHWAQRTVAKLIHLELLPINRCPSSRSAKISAHRSSASGSDSPGARPGSAVKPARRHTSSCISTMSVEPVVS